MRQLTTQPHSHKAPQLVGVATLLFLATTGCSQPTWRVDTRVSTGPVAQVALPSVGKKRRAALVVFEHARQCDPIFSFAEISGPKLGSPVGQSVLTGTKIGVVVNGKFHTWHAAISRYANGYEAGIAVTSDLFAALKGEVTSLAYITPDGERVALPVAGFRQAVQSALEACLKQLK